MNFDQYLEMKEREARSKEYLGYDRMDYSNTSTLAWACRTRLQAWVCWNKMIFERIKDGFKGMPELTVGEFIVFWLSLAIIVVGYPVVSVVDSQLTRLKARNEYAHDYEHYLAKLKTARERENNKNC